MTHAMACISVSERDEDLLRIQKISILNFRQRLLLSIGITLLKYGSILQKFSIRFPHRKAKGIYYFRVRKVLPSPTAFDSNLLFYYKT